jgi:ribosomal protein S18 acetylase RimI-like enzyme
MSIQYYFPRNEDEKFQLMEFIHKNTDSFILNTFGYVWENRGWWDKFPIQVYKVGDIIAGVHAFSVDTKAPNTIKTYYIVTSKSFRGQGIGKKMTVDLLAEYCNTDKNYYVNSEETSDGVEFYKKIFKNNFKINVNQFGTLDYVFEAPVKQLYNDLSNNINITEK